MKKHLVPSLFLLLTLTGCAEGGLSSSPSVIESVEPSASSSRTTVSSSVETSVSSSSASASSSEAVPSSAPAVVAYSDIATVKEACLAIADSATSAGYAVSSSIYKIKAKVLAVIDSVATGKDYAVSDRYKAFVQDKSGTMYAAIDEKLYLKLKDYVGQNNTVYTLEGKAGKYYEQAELVVSSFVFENEELPGLAPFSSFESKTLGQIKERLASLPISVKGISYAEPVVFEATYIDELVQENLLFSDGEYNITLHGSSKISNGFTKGSSYKVAALLSLYSYRPSLQFIGLVGSGSKVSTLPTPTPMTGAGQYAIAYAKDKAQHATKYENEFYGSHVFEGYVSTYIKSGETYFVLSDNESKEYAAYTNAWQDKALFVNNETEKGLYSQADKNRAFLAPYFVDGNKIRITYTPYMYNTSHYWMVFADLSSITVIE